MRIVWSWQFLILFTFWCLSLWASDLRSFRATCLPFNWRYHLDKTTFHGWLFLFLINKTNSSWSSCIHLSAEGAPISLLLVFANTRNNSALSQSVPISIFIFLMWRNNWLIMIPISISRISVLINITAVNILFLTALRNRQFKSKFFLSF